MVTGFTERTKRTPLLVGTVLGGIPRVQAGDEKPADRHGGRDSGSRRCLLWHGKCRCRHRSVPGCVSRKECARCHGDRHHVPAGGEAVCDRKSPVHGSTHLFLHVYRGNDPWMAGKRRGTVRISRSCSTISTRRNTANSQARMGFRSRFAFPMSSSLGPEIPAMRWVPFWPPVQPEDEACMILDLQSHVGHNHDDALLALCREHATEAGIVRASGCGCAALRRKMVP